MLPLAICKHCRTVERDESWVGSSEAATSSDMTFRWRCGVLGSFSHSP